MTIDRERIQRFLTSMRDHVAQLREIAGQGSEAFRNDFRNHQAAMRLLQICIEDMINVGGHIIARKSYGLPKDFADVFRILAERGIISADEEGRYARMARFRNRLVHVYWDIDLDQVFQILAADLGDFERFSETIGALLLTEPDGGSDEATTP